MVNQANEKLSLPDGSSLAYRRVLGKTPGIVFLGGFMSDMEGTKATYLETLCKQLGHAYVRFDYLGHGASSGRFEEGCISRWRDDALAILDQLTEGPQILVGSSMGGWLMVLVALARPTQIAGLIGIASAPDFSDDFEKAFPDLYTILQAEGICYLPSGDGTSQYPITRALLEDGHRCSILKSRIPLHCPVRLLHGLNDVSVPWEQSVKLAEQLESKDVLITLIKEGDHRLSNDANLLLLSKVLKELLFN